MPECTYCKHVYANPCNGEQPECENRKWLEAKAAKAAQAAEPKEARVPLEQKPKVPRVPLQ